MQINRKSLNEYTHSLTIGELIAKLTEAAEELGDDAEVRMMTQANYPFQHSIVGLVTDRAIVDALNSEGDDEEGEVESEEDAHGRAVYLVEGSQLAYGHKVAWDLV